MELYFHHPLPYAIAISDRIGRIPLKAGIWRFLQENFQQLTLQYTNFSKFLMT
jgi:hypothetical protein